MEGESLIDNFNPLIDDETEEATISKKDKKEI